MLKTSGEKYSPLVSRSPGERRCEIWEWLRGSPRKWHLSYVQIFHWSRKLLPVKGWAVTLALYLWQSPFWPLFAVTTAMVRRDGSRLCAEEKIDLTLFWCSCSSLLSFWPCLALARLRLDHLCRETGMKPTKTNRCWAEVTVSWKSSGSDATPSQRSTKGYFCLSNWTCLGTKVSWTLEQLTMKLLESGSCFSVVV